MGRGEAERRDPLRMRALPERPEAVDLRTEMIDVLGAEGWRGPHLFGICSSDGCSHDNDVHPVFVEQRTCTLTLTITAATLTWGLVCGDDDSEDFLDSYGDIRDRSELESTLAFVRSSLASHG